MPGWKQSILCLFKFFLLITKEQQPPIFGVSGTAFVENLQTGGGRRSSASQKMGLHLFAWPSYWHAADQNGTTDLELGMDPF